jgi:ubiquinone/menaquinone biosynthesis C-methylase UbiE
VYDIMKIEDYIEELKHDDGAPSYIEMDKDKEIHYMEVHKYAFKNTAKLIPISSEPIRILDIGPTPFTIFIKKKFQNYDVWALDRTELMKERLRQAGIQLSVCDLDECSLPFEDDYFDLVIFTEVLEHVFAPHTDVLREVKRIIRPSGKLILAAPNIASLVNRIKLLFGVTPLENADNQMKKEWVHGHGHIHEYTRKELLSLCKSLGFKISSVRMLSINPLYTLAQASLIKFFIKFFYYSIVFFIPPFRTSICVECHK